MPFSNPILAGTALVRTAIKSPNYVPGSAGWSINRDGTAEFSSATLRGALVAGGASPPDVVIGGTLPAALVAYYTGFGETALTGTVYFRAADAYEYEILVIPAGGGFAVLAVGGKNSGGGVVETYRVGASSATQGLMTIGEHSAVGANTGLVVNNVAQLVLNNTANLQLNDNVSMAFGNNAALTYNSAAAINLNLAGFGGDLLIDARSQPRGLSQRIDSTTATGALAAETVVLTLPSMTFKNGRAYRITFAWVSNQTAAGVVNVRARRGTTTAGAQRANWALPHNTTLSTTDQGYAYVKNSSGSDVTDQMVLTAAPGAGTVTVQGTPTTVQTFEVSDAGAAGDYANAIAI